MVRTRREILPEGIALISEREKTLDPRLLSADSLGASWKALQELVSRATDSTKHFELDPGGFFRRVTCAPSSTLPPLTQRGPDALFQQAPLVRFERGRRFLEVGGCGCGERNQVAGRNRAEGWRRRGRVDES